MPDDFLPVTVVEAMHAAARGDRGIRFVERDDDERFTSYADLRRNALALLARWTAAGARAGDEVVLHLEPAEQFVAALWACFFGKLIAVPLSAGSSPEHARKLKNVRARLQRPWIATSSAAKLDLAGERLLDASIPDADAPLAEPPAFLDPDALALVQFSSGSTGTPKGVTVTHAALLRNAADIALHARFRSTDRLLSWMPLTHDMGLIGFHIVGVAMNLDQIFMPTSLFIRRPVLWMKKCSEHRATVLYSPNFGYHYFLSAFRPEMAEGWDLGCARVVFNGAEPISAALCRRFAETLAPYGFGANAIVPAYGLAEATLLVTLTTPGEPLATIRATREALARGEVAENDVPDALELVMLGTPPIRTEIHIVDDEGAELPERRVGRIEMRGPTVTRGYYGDADATAAAIRDGWLDTGDLGFLVDGQLVVTGRSKDVIFVNGANYYPHDLERVSGLEPGEVVAAGVPRADGLREDLVVFVRHKGSPEKFAPIADSVRRRIAAETGLVVDRVIPVPKIPKTTSGKVQRHRLVAEHQTELLPALITLASELLGREVDPDVALADQGMSSMQAAELARRASALASRELPVSLAFDYPTLRAIAKHLSSASGARLGRALEAREDARTTPIAIIGAGLRFPGGIVDLDTFARALEGRLDAVTEVPRERWDVAAYPDARWGAFLDGVDQFDHRFFSISPVEAQAVDPQQRLLLETSWEALESAGLVPGALAGSDTGVFVGISNNDYASKHLRSFDPRRIDGYALTGSALATAAGRISYVYGFQGPCLAVDTACSSSLVAVHLAAQSLRAGECPVALAGGVNLILGPEVHIGFARLGAMAADGRCKVFDESADGYVRGEGCALIVLKRLSDAEAAGDPILAVLHGSAINQDGASNGLTAPNGLAQEQVIRAALRAANLDPRDVGYVEAHGTGTPLGDPQELHALASVYDRVYVGSVKSNLGHLESAAGIAGLLKAVIAVRNGRIPPNLHHTRPTPHFRWDKLQVPTEPVAWDVENRIAAISSFGFSGTNAHAIIGNAGVPPAEQAASTPPHILTITAKTPEALEATRQSWIDFLSTDTQPLEAIASTAAHRRTHHPHRLTVAGETRDDLIRELESATPPRLTAHPRKAVFIFPGQGGQWNAMGRELFAHDVLFRETIEQCDAAFRAYVDWSLTDAIRDGFDCAAGIDRVQPALFAIGVALARMWRARGIEPSAVVGHSMGEVGAAHVAGILSLEDAARVICRRSRIIRRAAGRGVMCSVELSAADARAALRGIEDRISIAAINSRESTVLSGDEAALDALMRDLSARGVFCRRIQVDVASHSPQMDPLRAELLEALRELAPHPPPIPMESTVLGRAIGADRLDAAYWVRNLREPVLFAPAIERLLARGERLFLEMSPHPVLVAAVEQEIAHACVDACAAGSLRRDGPDRLSFARSLAAVASVADVNWEAIVPAPRSVATLPRHAWQHERFWLDDAERAAAGPHPFLTSILERASDGARVAEGDVDVAEAPWLADHRVGDAVVFPAAAWIDAILAVAPHANALRDVELLEPLVLSSKRRIQIELARDGRFHAYARDGESWRMHVRGVWSAATPVAAVNPATPVAAPLSVDDFYATLDYGPSFRRITHLTRTCARIAAPDPTRDPRHIIDPAQLDAVFHPLLKSRGVVPVSIEELIIDRNAFRGELEVHIAQNEIIVPGALVARGVEMRAVDAPALTHDLVWRPAPSQSAAAQRTITWEAPSGDDVVSLTTTLVHFLQSVVRSQWTEMPRVRVITRGAHAIEESDACDPAQAALSAVVRTFAAEHPEFSPCAVDLPLHPTDEDRSAADVAGERQIAIRGGQAFAPRLVPRGPEKREAPAPRAAAGACFGAGIEHPGVLDRIALREMPEPRPGAGEAVVEVHAMGLNFLNVLSALGLYPGHPNGFRTLGMELSGVVTRAGAGFAEGDEVLGIAEHALASHVAARGELLFRKPPSISFDDAAALPIAYATAAWSLRHLARLRAGERVLIHSAAGGVGLAAIAIARAAGAEIIATASTEEKRALLRSMGIEQVFDPASFRTIEPVDVVLNALTGEARTASLALLAPGGRFVEIGKRWQDENRDSVTAANGAFFMVDLDRLAQDRPAELRALLEQVLGEIECGVLPLLPVRTFPIGATAEAFHLMAGGASSGKIVLRPREGNAVIEPMPIRGDATYLVTGGTGAIGSAVAQRLRERGAQSVLAIGRESGDIADERTFAAMLARIEREGRPPLRGIIHCAGVLDDAPLLQLTDEQIARVFAPKAAAKHLDAPELDFFVCVSSAAALFAPAGQANYAAASAYADALMHERRRRGQRATTVDLGPVGEVGLAASRSAAARVDALRSIRPLRVDEAVDLIEQAIGSPRARIIGIDLRGVAGDPLIGAETAARNDFASEIVHITDPDERMRAVEAHLVAHAAAVLRARPRDIDRDTPFKQLGIDSLMALQLKNRLRESLGITVPVTTFWARPTVAELSAHILEQIAPREAPPSFIESLTDEEAERLLLEKVR